MHNQNQSYQPPHISPSTLQNIKTSEEWKSYWYEQGQFWRTEPEIDIQRQEKLANLRTINPLEEEGIYPLSRVKLTRADIEWLLATHENKRGPVIWSDESQRERTSLDLRGASLNNYKTHPLDLTGLPLSRIISGPANSFADETQKIHIPIHLEGAILEKTHLEGADLGETHLEGARLKEARLEEANLTEAHLEKANLYLAHLEGADLRGAHLEGTNLRGAHLGRVRLTGVHLEDTNLTDISLTDKNHIGPFIADIQWGNTNLAVVDWSQIALLGEEYEIKKDMNSTEHKTSKITYLYGYKTAVRANRQLAVALQNQGLNEDAARFSYRAETLQKKVFQFQMIQDDIQLHRRISYLRSWAFSWFMFLVAGYGYRFGRSLLTYALVVCGFATAYYLLGINDIGPHNIPGPHHLSLYEAFVVSITAFHGRGFFVGTFSPADPQAGVAAIEAFLGLLIEVTFIATLTQRLFSR